MPNIKQINVKIKHIFIAWTYYKILVTNVFIRIRTQFPCLPFGKVQSNPTSRIHSHQILLSFMRFILDSFYPFRINALSSSNGSRFMTTKEVDICQAVYILCHKHKNQFNFIFDWPIKRTRETLLSLWRQKHTWMVASCVVDDAYIL